MTACSSRNASGPPDGVHDPLDLPVGRRDRRDLRVRAVLVGVRVVVREREQQEVEEVVLDEVGADAAGVLVAHARQPELRPAARGPAREQVGVEELARALDRPAEQRRRGDAAQGELARGLVGVAPAVHEIGRPRRADVLRVERLEDRPGVLREVLGVHVVDGVDELAVDAEAARRGERRPVLDVAALGARPPVHRRDVVAVLADAGRDRRRAHRRDRREGGGAGVDAAAARRDLRQRRGLARGDRTLDHLRLRAVDDGEDELHRRIRRPAYFS